MKSKTARKSKIAERDSQLVEIIKKGENEFVVRKAVNELFEKYKSSVSFHCRKYIKDPETIESIFLESFAKSITKLHQYEEEKAMFSTWLFAIASRCAIDFLRKKKEEAESLSDLSIFGVDGEALEYEFKSKDDTPEDELLKKERRKEVHRLIANMKNKKYKLVLSLRFFNNMSYEQIAFYTNYPLGTVKATLQRAIIELGLAVRVNPILKK